MICSPLATAMGSGPVPVQSVPGDGMQVAGSGGLGPVVGSTEALFVTPAAAAVGNTTTVIVLVPLAAIVPPLKVHKIADGQVQFVPPALTKLRFAGSLSATVAVVAGLDPAFVTTM